jgi:hypothetical protein
MEREVEFLRQQIDHILVRVLETAMSWISSLEARVAELERRPVAIVRAEESEKQPCASRSSGEELWLARSASYWQSRGGRKRG